MIRSMTGFGADIYSNDKFTLETEIKSLNSRFLDLSVKLPKELYKYEFAIRDLIKNRVGRGKVSVNINLTYNKLSDEYNLVDTDSLKKTVNLLSQINNFSENKSRVDLTQILMLKELYLNETQNDGEIEFDIISKSLNSAIIKFSEMKEAEGLELKKDLDLRIKNISEQLSEIENLTKNSVQNYFDKFKERVKKLSDEYVDDEDRFIQELAILSEKHDINEEGIRLKSHIKLFTETVENNEDTGRKLNFIIQEMNRETNTINSKSISSEISHAGILIKEELEKIREQIQNIE